MKSTSKHRTLKKVFLNVTACLTALVVTGSIIANECEVQLNSFLGTSSTKIVTKLPDGVTEEGYVRYYDSKYSTLAELKAAGNAKVREVEGEGIVLMKNENSVLPLAAGAKVSLVGVTAMDPVYGGTGSGAVDADGAPNYLDVLTGAGFDVVDKPLLNWYVSEEKSATATKSAKSSGSRSKRTMTIPWDRAKTWCTSSAAWAAKATTSAPASRTRSRRAATTCTSTRPN